MARDKWSRGNKEPSSVAGLQGKEHVVGVGRRRRVRPGVVDCEDGAGHPRVRSWRIHRIATTTAGWTKRNTTINLLDEEDEGGRQRRVQPEGVDCKDGVGLHVAEPQREGVATDVQGCAQFWRGGCTSFLD